MIKNRKKYIKNIKNINYILWKKNIFFPGIIKDQHLQFFF